MSNQVVRKMFEIVSSLCFYSVIKGLYSLLHDSNKMFKWSKVVVLFYSV